MGQCFEPDSLYCGGDFDFDGLVFLCRFGGLEPDDKDFVKVYQSLSRATPMDIGEAEGTRLDWNKL